VLQLICNVYKEKEEEEGNRLSQMRGQCVVPREHGAREGKRRIDR